MPEQLNIPITLKDVQEPNLLYRFLRKIADAITVLASKVNTIETSKLKIDYDKVRSALQAGGSTPLDVQGLQGVLTQPQPAGAARLTAIPTGQLLQTYYDTQLLVIQNGTTYDLYSVKSGNPTSLIQLLAGGGPTNMVTTDTTQTISGQKTFSTEQIIAAAAGLLKFGGTIFTNGAAYEFKWSYEEVNVAGGTSIDSTGNLLISNSLVFPVLGYITQTISGGGVSKFSSGDSTTTDRFLKDNSNLTVGTGFFMSRHWAGSVATDAAGPTQASDAKIRTTLDAAPTQGKIRYVTLSLVGTTPTS